MGYNRYTTPGNEIVYQNEYEIGLRCSNCDTIFTISPECLSDVQTRTWYLNRFGYIMSTYMNKNVRLHRYLLRYELDKLENTGLVIDHIDRNPLNNRLDNLRIVHQRINKINSSQTINSKRFLLGVSKEEYNGRIYYRSEIFTDGKDKLLGTFDDPYDAALVHDRFIYLYKSQYEWDATNIRNGLIPQEILLKYNINPYDLSTIPFIPTSKHSSSKYNGLTFCKKRGLWNSYVKDERDKLKITGTSKNEDIAAMKREIFISNHPEIDISKGCNKLNSIPQEEKDGLISIANVLLTKDEMEEKKRGY